MKEWVIYGGKELSGIIKVSGAKNSLLAILPASIITKSMITLENVPPLEDTYVMIDILNKLNVRVIYDNKDKMIIDARNVKNIVLNDSVIKKIRASYYFMGALLSLYKNVNVIGPGGCKFATRPIDLHLYAFSCLGCSVNIKGDLFEFDKNKIKSREIKFEKVSVGATINAILASCRCKGKIRLINAAKEPEIDDLINFLNKCGGSIKREGNEIIVKGVNKFKGCKYRVMEDRIEASTYLILGSLLGNYLKIEYKNSDHINSLIDLLKRIGVSIAVYKDYILVNKIKGFKGENLIFDVYPHLPTDIQQPLSILMSRANEGIRLEDKVYPSRYTQIEELKKMGFIMDVRNNCLYVNKSDDIKGKEVVCKDLRGGVSLVIASCIAKGRSVIKEVYHINRGYYNLINKLKGIGVRIDEKI